MVSFNKLTRTLAGIAAAALIVPLAACGGSGNGGTATARRYPGQGHRRWYRDHPVDPFPSGASGQERGRGLQQEPQEPVKLEIIPNDDMEGKVGGASQTDSLPDILAGDVVRIPYWASEASSPTSPSKSMAWTTRPTCSRATSKPVLLTAPSTPCRSSLTFP